MCVVGKKNRDPRYHRCVVLGIFEGSIFLVAEGGEGLGCLGLCGGVLLRLGELSCGSLLALVVGQRLGLSAVLQADISLVFNHPHLKNPTT